MGYREFDGQMDAEPAGGGFVEFTGKLDAAPFDSLVSAIRGRESGGNPNAVSPQGARGAMQIMPATFKEYAAPGESFDNDAHRTNAALRKLKADFDFYGGDPVKTAAAYLGGRGAVRADGTIRDDVKDALGTTPAAYAEQVVKRMGGGNAVAVAAKPARKNVLGHAFPSQNELKPLGPVEEPAAPSTELGGMDTAKLIGGQILDAAFYHLPGAFAAAIEGDDPYREKDWKDSLIDRSRARSKGTGATGDKDIKTALPGVSAQDVKQLGPSLGFSVVGAGAGLAAGVPAGIAGNLAAPAAGTVAGYTAGMAASGAAAYRMATNQFVRDLHDAANDDSLQRTGKPISDVEFQQKQAQLAGLIKEYGLWEAVPEAAGNALGFGILKAPVKGAIGKLFGSNILTRLATKMGALYGEELATETVTQHGQHNVEVDAGLSNEPKRSWTSPEDMAQSFKEVAPSTILQTTLMAGGTKAGMKLYDRMKGQPSEGSPALAPGQADDSINLADLYPEAPGSQFANSEPVPVQPEAMGMQNRDRGTAASILQMQSIANAPDFDRLGASPIPDVGAPMVSIKDNAEGAIAPEDLGQGGEITLPDGSKVGFHYAVVDADRVQASHDAAGNINPAYADAPAGTVVALNNGRTAGLQAAYTTGTAAQPGGYRDRLMSEAMAFGIDPQAVAGKAAPILVRVYDDAVNARPDIARQANSGGSMGMSAQEVARNDAAVLPDLRNLVVNEDGEFDPRANAPFVRGWVASLPQNEQAQVTDRGGNLSQVGAMRLRNAIIAKAYGDNSVFGRLVESLDDSMRNVGRALVRAAPKIAQVRELIAAGAARDLDIGGDINRAVDDLVKLRQAGMSLADFLAQANLFADQKTAPESLEILSFLDANLRSPNRIADFLSGYYTQVEAMGSPGQGYMFGGPEVGRGDLIRSARAAAMPQTTGDVGNEQRNEPGRADSGSPAAAGPAAADAAGNVGSEAAPAVPGADGPGGEVRGEPAGTAGGSGNTGQPAAVEEPKTAVGKEARKLREKMSKTESAPVQSEPKPQQGESHGLQDQGRRQEASEVLTGPAPDSFGAGNKVFTEDRAAKARELLRKKLAQVNSGIDPEMVQAGIELAGFYIEGGARKFADYAGKMVADLGEAARPYLKSWYLAVRNYPGFDNAGMESEADLEAAEKRAAIKADVEKIKAKRKSALAYVDGQVLPFNKVDGFLSQYVYGIENGGPVPNPTFIVGQLSAQAIETIGKFIDGFGEQYSTVRVSGRSLKHTDEQRHDLFSAIVSKLPEILAAPDLEVLHNPSREASAFIVYRRPKVEGPNALVVIEIAKNGNGTDIVNMIAAGDRQVRQFERRSAEWLEGRHSLIPAAERSPAGGEVSDVQPLSNGNVAPEKTDGNTVDAAAHEAATSPKNGKPEPTQAQEKPAEPSAMEKLKAVDAKIAGGEIKGNLAEPYETKHTKTGEALFVVKIGERVERAEYDRFNAGAKKNGGHYSSFRGRGAIPGFQFKSRDKATAFMAEYGEKKAPEPVVLAENEVQLPDIKSYIYGKKDGEWNYKAVGAKYEGYAGKISTGPLLPRLEAALREKRGDVEPAAESPTMTNEGAKDNGQSQQLGERAGRAETGNDQGSREPGPAGVRDSGPVGERLEEKDAQAGSERGTSAEAPGTGGSREGSAANDGARGRVRLDGGDGVSATAGRERRAVSPRRDFTITDDLNIGAGGQKTKFQANVAAIRLLKQLEADGRMAAPDEQQVLARYVGWGGLKGAFDQNNGQWSKEYAELKDLLTPEEYAAARRTILDAHYTSVPVVRSIWSILERLGFAGGRVLESSVGIGNFIGLMPLDLRAESNVLGVELDSITARIAGQLYQKERIVNRGFQDLTVADGHFDAAVGNPPFGSQNLFDENHKDLSKLSIHNFFIAKSLLKTRPGGVAAFVVSRYFLDAQDPAARQAISQHSRFVGAVRLPYTAFKENAGTEVVTDIVVFQRLAEGEKADAAWTETGTINVGGNDVQVNRYFIDNPGRVLGQWSMTSTMYSANQLNVIPGDRPFEEELSRAVEQFPEGIYRGGRRSAEELSKADAHIPEGVEVGGLFVDSAGKIAQRMADVNGKQRSRVLEDMGEIPTARARGMIAIREALLSLMRSEMQGAADDVLAAKRQALNSAYDSFVKKYGYLNALSNRRSFQEDPRQPLLEALEVGYDPGVSRETAKKMGVEARGPSAKKAAIFSRRVLAPYTPVTHAGTANDALVASLAERGKVDMPYMSRLYGKSEDEIAAELGDMVYRNPETNRYEVADDYLSGNVKAKLAQAREAAANDKAFKRNVTALEAVQPKDIPAKDIFVRMGAPWIPGSDVVKFAKGLIGEAYGASATYIPAVGRWSFSGNGGDMATTQSRWGTSRVPFSNLMDLLLNGRPIIVKDNIGTREQPHWVVNDAETEAARAKGEEISREFGRWIWDDPDRRGRLEKDYNDRFNTDRDRVYDGSHLSLPGASPLISLRKHQKDGIWRILQDRVALMDHVVGAGKSMLLTGAAMELRRLGFAKKPMFAVPNHLVRQWRDEFYKLYPAANILVATEKDFEKANRQRLFGRIATGDWDAVIVAHSSFKKIGMPKETEAEVIGEMRDELAHAIEAMKRERGDRNVIRDMERIKENLDAKIKKLADKGGKKDAVATLDELGVDALFVDEAHAYKNLFFFSQMQNVAGLGSPAGSGRAFDMFVKLRYLERAFGGKAPVVFATGTPVSNSLVEMFTMQRYLAYDELKRRGIHLLDPWANTFGDAKQVYEVHPSGNGYRLATRFAQFVNMGELMQLYGGFADVITLDDLKKQASDRGERFPVPKLKGGKPQLVVAERSEEQTRFFGVPEFQRLEGGDVVFELDGSPQDYSVGADKDKKFGVFKAGSPYAVKGGFESAEAAGEWLHSALRTPKMQYNQGSILWKFENLKRLNKETKGKVNALSITNEARKAGLDFRLIDAGAPDFKGSKINLAAKNMKRIYDAWHADKGTQLVFCDLSVPKSAAETMTMPVFYRQDGKVVEGEGRPAPLEGMPDWSMPLLVKAKEQAQGEEGKKRARTVWKYIEAHTGLVLGAGSPTEAQGQALAALPSSIGRLQSLYESRGPMAEEEIEALQEGKEEEGGEEGGESVSLDQLMALKSKFSVYEDLRDKLVKAGIPQNEIAFIHDYDTAAKKQALFKDVNAGRVRLLIGSTEKMGAGMNVQERLVAIHHLDAPWRPSDLEQRNGRMMRQGNQLYLRDPDGFEVEELRYATKQTYDTRMWQIQEHKARGVEQLRAANKDTRTIEDVAGDAANAADMKAAASGNPLILDEIKLRNETTKLENLERAYQNSRWDLQNRERVLEGADRREAEGMAEIKPWFRARDENPADPFEFTIDGKRITDKKELAGPVIEKAKVAIAAGSSSQRTIVGTYRGVTVGLVTGYRDVLTASVSVDGRDWQWLGDYAKGDNFSPAGLLQRIDNRLAGLDERVKELRAKAEKERAELPKIRAELAKPFEHEQALAETRQRHRAVVKKLQEQGGAIEMTSEMMSELTEAMRKRGIMVRSHGRATDPASQLSVRELSEIAGETFKQLSHHPEFRIIDGLEEVGLSAPMDGSVAAGFIMDQRIHLVRSGISSRQDAVNTLWHELFHYGLRRFLSEDQYIAELGRLYQRDYFLRQKADFWIGNDYVAKQLKEKGKSESYLKARGVDEALAEFAEGIQDRQHFNKNGWMAKVLRRVTAWLADIADHFDSGRDVAAKLRGITNEEARRYVMATFAKLKDGKTPVLSWDGDRPAFSFAAREGAEKLDETINVDGIDRPTMNSNGKPISKVDGGLRNFWRWFGDSQVIDADGRPLVVFHGTRSSFDSFSLDNQGKSNGLIFSRGIYMTGNPAYAGMMTRGEAGGNIMPVYAVLKNPVIFESYADAHSIGVGGWSLIERDDEHDGVIVKDGGELSEIIAFRPSQIKSASGNSGKFDGANPDIRFSRSGGRGTIHIEDLNAVAATFRAGFPGIPVVVLEHERQAPDQMRKNIREAGAVGTVAGAFHDGSIYLIRDAIQNVEHAEHVVLHEGVHGGLRQLFGQSIEPVMLDIWKNNLKVQLAAKKIREQYGYSHVRSIEEALADMGSTAPKLKGWERLVGWVRAKLRKLGFVTDWTDKDIDALVQRALSTLKQGGRQSTVYSRTAFSRIGQEAQGPDAQDIDAKVASILSKRRGASLVDSLVKGATKAVGIDRATAFAGAKARQLIDALVPEGVKAGMVSDYGVPEAVTDRRDAMFGHMRRQLREVENTLVRLSTLTRQESRIAYEWMNNRDADHLLEQLPEESRQVLQELKGAITGMGQEAVRLGQLDHDTFERHAMAYLHRSYRKWDLEASDGEKRTRARAIKVLGDQYKGRGLTDLPAMSAIKNTAPEWWNRKIQKGKADKQLRGQKFIRFERRANRGEGVGALPGMDDSGQLGRLQEVNYWPANEPVPAKYAGWHNAQVWEVRGTKGEKVVMWRDFTTDERATMGEIDEVRFAVAKTMHKMIHDLEVGKFFEWLAANQALPEDRLPRAARVVEARESMLATFTENDWVQVPDAAIPGTRVKRYGKLAGLYVPGPVWNDVRQVANFKFNPLGEHYAALLKAWKISKTALSPAVHLNNIMANFVMADWHDVTWRDTLDALAVLVGQKDAANQKIIELFEDAGGTQGMYVLSEIQREQLAPLVDQLRKEVGIADVDGQIGAASILQAMMRFHVVDAAAQASMTKAGRLAAKGIEQVMDLYHSEDTVFRLAAFMKAKREGASDMEAGRAARQSFLDYQINAPWVQMMRQTAFPFIAFTYRAVPMLLHTIEKKPWKLLKLGLVLGAVNAIGYAMSGGDEDKERRLLPEEKAGRVLGGVAPKLIRMPWNHEMKDTAGNKTMAPVFLDIRRFIPLGDIVDMGQTHSAVPVLPMALPGGPLAVLAELVANKSQFTGKEITQGTDTGMEKVGKVFDHLYKAFAPNLVGLPGTYATKAVVDAGKGRTDSFGREQSLAMAGLSSVGVKLGAYPPDVARMNLGLDFKADRAEIERNMRRNAREYIRNGMSDDEFRDAMKRDIEKLQKRGQEYAEKVQ